MDRRPALPVAVDQDTHRIRVDSTGVLYADYEMVYTEYDVGRIREGYCCIECGEAQEASFPEKCSACGYPMHDEQVTQFGRQFEGPTTIGPSRSLEELRAEDEETKERARWNREKPTSRIWVPG